MNTPPDQTLSFASELTPRPPTAQAKRRFLPGGCFQWGLAGFIILVLIFLMIPTGPVVQVRGMQTKALIQAKQIGLALKLFADDNNGNYPRQEIPAEMTDAPKSSNTAFACLFPTYITSEKIFGNKLSAYSSGQSPDDLIDNPYTGHPVQTLRPGENVYGYVMGLTDKSAPDAPLIVDGTDGTGHYTTDGHARGGVWKGAKAVVIRLDNSGAVETLVGPDNARYIPGHLAPRSPVAQTGATPSSTPYVSHVDAHAPNLLDVAGLGKDVRFLDPAIPPK